MSNPPLLVIVGPTAVGKTGLSVRLAQDFPIEIISADSRQIYRHLDIGTAKPTPQERAAAPHHLVDVVEPDEVMTLAEFQTRAYAAIEAVLYRQHLPVLVGGTGQWVKAVVEGWRIPRVPPDMVLRSEFEALVETEGNQALHNQLAAVDPAAAQKIDPRNVRRVIRALEVYQKTGIPISEHQRKQAPPYQTLQIGLTRPREQLYERIDRRIEQMMEMGFLAEVEQLFQAGYGADKPAMSGLGYKQLGQYLKAQISLVEAVALIKKETRRFVRQQYNWFRLNDDRIHWFDLEKGVESRYEQIRSLIKEKLLGQQQHLQH